MSEEQQIQDIKKNPKLFGLVYDAHYDRIFNYCFKRTKDFNISKDITSETFLKAFLNINKFKWCGISLLSWLYKIATNEINLYYRSKKYRPLVLSEIGLNNIPESNIGHIDLFEEMKTAEKELNEHKQFIKVQKALIKLPLKYQEIICLKYFEKLKIKEISEVLNKPQGTIKSLLSRGIKLLKTEL